MDDVEVPESEGAEEVCERSEMTRRSCMHCRDAGLYTPPQGSSKARQIGLTSRNTEGLGVALEDDGSVWVHADEGMRRGKFGYGAGGRHGD